MALGYFIHKRLDLRICVRNAISKVYICVWFGEIVLELKLECLSFKAVAAIPLNKTHIESVLLGPFLISWFGLCLLIGLINIWLHSLIIESLSFSHVTNI